MYKDEKPDWYRFPNNKIEWNAKEERWEFEGKPFKASDEILWCSGYHEGLRVHDPWWCLWKTEQGIRE